MNRVTLGDGSDHFSDWREVQFHERLTPHLKAEFTALLTSTLTYF